MRVTLGGADLQFLASAGLDRSVRLFFPRQGQDELWMPTVSSSSWMAQVLLQPAHRRPWVRMYTVRRIRLDSREVDIDIVLHGDHAPGSGWARHVAVGTEAGILDEGTTYVPFAAAHSQLLVADESAAPALLSILETSPRHLETTAVVELPTAEDIRALSSEVTGAGSVQWIARDRNPHARKPGHEALDIARSFAVPDPPTTYAWAAGESGLAAGVRRHLRSQGLQGSQVTFVGYWR